MKRLKRTEVFKNYGSLTGLPNEPRLRVDPNERFLLETLGTTGHIYTRPESASEPPMSLAGNTCTGPVGVNGIKAGDVIACHIHAIEPVGHAIAGVPGTLAEGFTEEDDAQIEFEDQMATHFGHMTVLIPLEDGMAKFAGDVMVPIRPMAGCIGVVPDPFPVPEPWKHGGNMDITAVCPGSKIHIKAQRDEAWVCAGDCHALQGEGEINGAGLEMASDIVMSVTHSTYTDLEWPLVETEDRFLSVGIDNNWTVAVKTAMKELTKLMVSARGLTFSQAYLVVSSCADVRNGSVFMMLDHEEQHNPITVTISMDKELFRK